MDDLKTTKQLQEILQLSRKSIHNRRKEGMPFVRVGPSIRFDLKAVQKWINESGEKSNEYK